MGNGEIDMINRIKFIVIDKGDLEKENTWKAPTIKINGKQEVVSFDIADNKKIFVYESAEGCNRSGVVEINQSVIERASVKVWHNFNRLEQSLLKTLFHKQDFGRMDKFFECTKKVRAGAEKHGAENMYLFSKYINTALIINRDSFSKIVSNSSGDACLVDKNELNIVDYKWSFMKSKDRYTERVFLKINRINDVYHGMQLSAYLYMKKKGDAFIQGKELHHKYDCMDNRLGSTVLLLSDEHKKQNHSRHAYQYKIETFAELLCFLIFVNRPEYKRLYS